jgi:adenine-specific DNA-methyltransferase
MPTLHWVGKNKVVNHHHDVPFRLLDKQYSFTANDGTPANSKNNRIIHGDNLESLKSLLPEFEGKVNCIYIDPPYNTGNEEWRYNDAVNDPKIKKWLGQLVGKEGEDLSRHDKWLCMMYPRLKLLSRLLADDGIIFVSIDDNEQAALKFLLDEIFGARNFVAQIAAITNLKGRNDKKHISACHEYILIYANRGFQSVGLPLTEEQKKAYCHLDESNNLYALRDLRKRGGPDKREDRPNMFFPIYHSPETGKLSLERKSDSDIEILPLRGDGSEGRWRWGIDKVGSHLDWLHAKAPKKKGRWGVEHRIYLDPSITVGGVPEVEEDDEEDFDDEDEVVERSSKPKSFWMGGEFSTDSGKRAVKATVVNEKFEFPKSVDLIARCIQMSTAKNAIILDSFGGSGTTAHAVLKINAQDNGTRRFILCEMMNYAETVTAERVRSVMNGYGEGKKAVAGTGGAFDFYNVGDSLFKEDKNLNEEVGAEAIRGYVAYTENIPSEKRWDTENAVSPYALGSTDSALCVFYYEKDRVTTLDIDFLGQLKIKNLPSRPEQFVIYADKCALDKDFLYKHGITFKRIPRDITRF